MNHAAPPTGGVEIGAGAGRAALERFIRLPERLYRAEPHYVRPLRSERRAALTPGSNPFFRHADAGYELAQDVARERGAKIPTLA